MKKTTPYDWTPSLILIGCTVLFPGPGFLIGGIAFCAYVLLKALLFPPAADTEGGGITSMVNSPNRTDHCYQNQDLLSPETTHEQLLFTANCKRHIMDGR